MHRRHLLRQADRLLGALRILTAIDEQRRRPSTARRHGALVVAPVVAVALSSGKSGRSDRHVAVVARHEHRVRACGAERPLAHDAQPSLPPGGAKRLPRTERRHGHPRFASGVAQRHGGEAEEPPKRRRGGQPEGLEVAKSVDLSNLRAERRSRRLICPGEQRQQLSEGHSRVEERFGAVHLLLLERSKEAGELLVI